MYDIVSGANANSMEKLLSNSEFKAEYLIWKEFHVMTINMNLSFEWMPSEFLESVTAIDDNRIENFSNLYIYNKIYLPNNLRLSCSSEMLA